MKYPFRFSGENIVDQKLSILASGHASDLFSTTTFMSCVGFDRLFPEHAIFRAWQNLLLGFYWISWGDFVIGLIWSYRYGRYNALQIYG